MIVSRLRIEGQPARYLMIEDPIPAGCEQVEAVSGIDLNYRKTIGAIGTARANSAIKSRFLLNYFSGKATYQYAMRVEAPDNFASLRRASNKCINLKSQQTRRVAR
jgi:hypothetical protein